MLEEYAAIGYLRPMETYLAEAMNLNPEIYNRIEENIVRGQIETEDKQIAERIIGINLDDSPLIKGLDLYIQDLHIGVSASARQSENIVTALVALFE